MSDLMECKSLKIHRRGRLLLLLPVFFQGGLHGYFAVEDILRCGNAMVSNG